MILNGLFIRHDVAVWKILVSAIIGFIGVAAWFYYGTHAKPLEAYLRIPLSLLCVLYFAVIPVAIFMSLDNTSSTLLRGLAVIIGILSSLSLVLILLALLVTLLLGGGIAPLG